MGPGRPALNLPTMPPKSRILSSLLAGLGVALLVAGLLAPRVMLSGAVLPLDLGEATWTIEDADGLRDGEPAPVVHQLHMEIQNPSDGETASVRIGDTLRAGAEGSDFDRLISASTWSYVVDRTSGEAVGPADAQLVMAMPAAQVLIDAPWLKLPSPVKRETVEVFDPVLRGPAPAEYVGEEEIAGRTVYRFRQEIAPTNIAQRYADMRNTLTVDGPDGPVRTFLFHAAQRELLVDQVTGVVVGVIEKVDDYYGAADGRGVRNIVTYDGEMPREHTEALLGRLSSGIDPATQQIWTWVVLGLGALLTVLGLFGAMRPRRGAATADPTDTRGGEV